MNTGPTLQDITAQIEAVGQKAMTLIEGLQSQRAELRAALMAVLARDAADRSLPQLLREAAMVLDHAGGGPLADCLRLKAESIETTIAELQL